MLALKSSSEVAIDLAHRVRSRRLRRRWTQAEMAERAGLRLPTYVLFERSGKISLIRLLKILDVLGLLDEFDRVGRSEDLFGMTLDELTEPERKRGHRLRS
jgi:transcriptional regulator with XRE-family HTH domain